MTDPEAKTADRIKASELLADRGWGKCVRVEPIEVLARPQVPQEQVDAAVERFRAEVRRLSERSKTA